MSSRLPIGVPTMESFPVMMGRSEGALSPDDQIEVHEVANTEAISDPIDIPLIMRVRAPNIAVDGVVCERISRGVALGFAGDEMRGDHLEAARDVEGDIAGGFDLKREASTDAPMRLGRREASEARRVGIARIAAASRACERAVFADLGEARPRREVRIAEHIK